MSARPLYGEAGCLVAALLAAAAHGGGHALWPLAAALALLALAWRSAPRSVRASSLVALAGACLAAGFEAWSPRVVDGTGYRPDLILNQVETRARGLVDELAAASARLALQPQSAATLLAARGPSEAGFAALERSGVRAPGELMLTLADLQLVAVAWNGQPSDLEGLLPLLPTLPGVIVLDRQVATAIVAVAPVLGPGRRPLGFALAERVVATRSSLRGTLGSDRDDLTTGLAGVEVDYLDLRLGERAEDSLARPGTAVRALRSPGGHTLAFARATDPVGTEPTRLDPPSARLSLSLLGALPFVAALHRRRTWPQAVSPVALAIGCGLRALWLLAAPPWPGGETSLLDPAGFGVLGYAGLLATPFDALLTALVLAHMAAALLRPALAQPERSLWLQLLASLAAPALLVIGFLALQQIELHSTWSLAGLTVLPLPAGLLALRLAALLLLAATLALVVGSLNVAWPRAWPRRAGLLLVWLGLALLVRGAWPRDTHGLPLVPLLVAALLALTIVSLRARWHPWLLAASGQTHAIVAVLATGVLGLLLQPSLSHFSEKAVRRRIELDYVAMLRRQPLWRHYALEQACRRIDSLLPETERVARAGLPPEAGQLAFSLWSQTDLAALGPGSAVELRGADGRVLARFALDLPSLEGAREVGPTTEWRFERRRLSVGAASRDVLHAARRLSDRSGSVQVDVALDEFELPFLGGSPSSVPFLATARMQRVEQPDLIQASYELDGRVHGSNVDPPPPLSAELRARLSAQAPQGLWTTLDVEGREHHFYLVTGGDGYVHALGYPRLDAVRFLADTLEAGGALLAASSLLLLLLLIVRTLAGRHSLTLRSVRDSLARRFGLRLFVAFVAAAVLPVFLLQVFVRGLLADRLREEAEGQALQSAAVAQKAVADYASFEHDRGQPPQPIDDAALVWIASLVRGDLDIFQGGRLRATSQREAYASGLLSERLEGSVYHDLVLRGLPRVSTVRRVGNALVRAIAVPVALGGREPGVLTVPLQDRPQQRGHALADLDRALRAASALFVLAAGILAQSLAGRIARPLRDLTDATRRLAKGDLTTRVVTDSRDELLALFESFNQMAQDLARQRQDLERSNRLAAWAEMARRVAHEVKNPLTPIQLSAEHLRRVYGDAHVDFGAVLETCTQTILKQVRNLRSLVTEFSAYARPPAQPEEIDVAGLLSTATQPYLAALPAGVTLAVTCAPDLPCILGDRRLLERAVVNLIENALQAVAGHGHVELRGLASEHGLALSILDDGPGIDPTIRARIFEPFFSTKLGGSGLGLSLVKKIVEDLGGHVELRSEPGHTEVTAYFPTTTPP